MEDDDKKKTWNLILKPYLLEHHSKVAPIADLSELVQYVEEYYERLSDLLLIDDNNNEKSSTMMMKFLHCNMCSQDFFFPYSWFFHCSCTNQDDEKLNICSSCILTSASELEKHCNNNNHKGIEFNYLIRIYNRYYINMEN
jgi:hypothetical protein